MSALKGECKKIYYIVADEQKFNKRTGLKSEDLMKMYPLKEENIKIMTKKLQSEGEYLFINSTEIEDCCLKEEGIL